MKFSNLYGMYFSPTGTTARSVMTISAHLGAKLDIVPTELDFTLPHSRQHTYEFSEQDLLVIGVPVYAGRVPNLLLPWLRTPIGNGATCIPIVSFGNRNFDDALIELRNLLEENGFHTIAAAAFVGEHSFSSVLAAGRPDARDLSEAKHFANLVAERILATPSLAHPVAVRGEDPIRPYYQPRDRYGAPIDIRKVKPKTSNACNHCMLCAKFCPMGAIDFNDATLVPGICIKCGACIKKCPKSAKYYNDAGYLYHQHELEEIYIERAENAIFV